MYRQHIETPLSIPEDLKKDMDFYNGEKMGRIYRIMPENAPSLPVHQTFPGNLQADGLVKLLSHPNRWWRLHAQRLLVMRDHKEAIPKLKQMIGEFDYPQARLHALYALEGLDALDAKMVEKMLEDLHPQIRVHAIRLSERYPALLPKLLKMIEDDSPFVALQLTLTLGGFGEGAAKAAIQKISARFPEDKWIQLAVTLGGSNSYSSR